MIKFGAITTRLRGSATSVLKAQKLSLGRHCQHGWLDTAVARQTTSAKRNISTAEIPEILQLHPDIKCHSDLHRFSIQKPDEFWGPTARTFLDWMEDFTEVSDCRMEEGRFRWFADGVLNACVNCVDRHADKHPHKVALVWEKDEPGKEERITYKELLDNVCRMANLFKANGIRKGDVVGIYMPTCPLAVTAMLACARLGIIHNVIFAGFSSEAVATRLRDAEAVAIVTADSSIRGGKHLALKSVVDAALKDGKCSTVKHIFTSKEYGISDDDGGSDDLHLEKEMETHSDWCDPERMNAEDYLFILYTSGSTGVPKGLAHSTAGYLLYAGFTHKHVFGYYDNQDVFGCVADVGWVTGHSYVVYGPLVNGGTTLLFDSTPTYPDPRRYWNTIERLKINQFYCAPTAIRLLIKHGEHFVREHDLSSLKTIGSVGEPINADAWHWLNDIVGQGRCDIVDTWWQTETGGVAISPRPSEDSAPILPGLAMRPCLGMNPVLLDGEGKEILETKNVKGALCLKAPWPGIARTVYGHHQRYLDTYFNSYPGYYFSGDGARRDAKGFWEITGRMDDVINISGHRLGTAEVESVLGSHPSVAEAAVVGFPHEVKGEAIYAFVVLKDDVYRHILSNNEKKAAVTGELKTLIRTNIAAFATPETLQLCKSLPKTRSGKIMRRILRRVASGFYDELGDISTLAEPEEVEDLIMEHARLIFRSNIKF